MRPRDKQALQSIEWPADALVAAAENLERQLPLRPVCESAKVGR